MIEFFLAVLSSILGNILTPSFKKWTGFKDDVPTSAPPPSMAVSDPADEEELEQRRRYIQEQWEIRSWSAFVFFTLIFFVGVAITMPVWLKTGFFSQPLECDTILLANLCGGSYWKVDAVKTMLIPLIILCVIGIWFLAQAVANPIAHYVHYNHQRVGPILYRRILAMTIIFFAFVLCGHWVYFLFPKYGYGTSVLLPFFVVGMVGAFSSSRR